MVLTRSQAGRLRGDGDGLQVFDFTDPTAGKVNSLSIPVVVEHAAGADRRGRTRREITCAMQH